MTLGAIASRRRRGLLGIAAVLAVSALATAAPAGAASLAAAGGPLTASLAPTISVPTKLEYTGPTSAPAGAGVELSAVLSAQEEAPSAIGKQKVVFRLGKQTCSGFTDEAGSASCTIKLEQPAGHYILGVEFEGESGFGPSSAEAEFTIVSPPAITILPPPTPSNNVAPTFSGTVSEGATEVAVHVLFEGKEVATGHTAPAAGKWSATITPNLPGGDHVFTAYATATDFAGEGRSSTVSFEVDTEPPLVTLNKPPTPSSNHSPTFSGTVSQPGTVTVHVYSEEKTEIDQGTTAVGSAGSWSLSLVKPLPAGKHRFFAIATAPSAIGNPEGQSESVTFEVVPPVESQGCTIKSLPSFVDQGSLAQASSVADVVQVHCPPSLSEQPIELSSQQLLARCAGHLSWASPREPEVQVQGRSIKVEVDDDGNATAVLWGGPSCAAGEVLIAADELSEPFETSITAFKVLPPKPTHAGVKALPASEVEDATSGSVATIIQIAFQPVYAGQSVDVVADQVAARCQGAPLVWIGADEAVLHGAANAARTLKLDNDGNAFVVLLAPRGCAAGASEIEASLVGPPYTRYATTFSIKPPAVVH